MNEMEKLRVLLPHWIEHNQEHAGEFARWADVAADAGNSPVAELIRNAIANVQQANAGLQEALDLLGGPLSSHTHHHHH